MKPLYRFLLPVMAFFVPLLTEASVMQQKQDSTDVYRKIRKAAYKHKFTRFLYSVFFVDPVPGKVTGKPILDEEKRVNPFLEYQGKVIRKVYIERYDPFGFSVNDTTKKPVMWTEKAGNKVHISTHRRVIRNFLLFRENDTLDPLTITESERVLRQNPFINDVRIFVKPVPGGSDSVDVLVLEHDKWSITASGNISIDRPDIRITDKNILGFGHMFQLYGAYSVSSEKWKYNGRYIIPNIRNTFISSTLYYNSADGIEQLSLSFDRPFYSPLTKWAGGLSAGKTWAFFNYTDTTDQLLKPDLEFMQYDVWLARSFPVGGQRTLFGRSSSFITSLRYFDNDITQRPSFSIDTGRSNRNFSFCLAGFGIAVRQYYKEQYIYRFGANEDVPEGFTAQLVYGVMNREFDPLLQYAGFQVSRGRHFKHFGYLSASGGYGTFFRRNQLRDGVVNASFSYFSDLVKGGRWYFRQFVNGRLVYGLDRVIPQQVNINGRQMNGFNSPELQGTGKMILSLQTVMYAPYTFMGFRFAPVLLAAFGQVGQSGQFPGGRIYQVYALGLLVRNENVLVNTFSVSLGFYPYIPALGRDVFKYNPIGSFNLRLQDFMIAKPDMVPYE